jgi:hydroxymethylpyrimidine pyrophosphatase-like HAD family hydrolase
MQKIIYFDVDDTLVRSVGKKRIVMPSVIAQVKRLKQEGALIYLWSSGGAEYCRLTAIELGIEDCFIEFLPKPTTYIDDQPVSEWRLCKHLYPSQADFT